ncbi:Uma2 family endonuclease [Nodosilinea sp. LEGE 07088]|uniref:Uma2 family endonuclease n=1 Tax=Nodosilinea sp. LEGE 07088 TaxID=2777968 RepID=UPI0018817B05|nr:Uma2 family endonuclease [Nodosilinea sp. LEGE 07088]MBE9136991.1 Uma2 family endonuclease [Nodosilinea sp. LEGE 07088]
MVLLNDVSNRLTLEDSEERRVFSQVSWQQYEALLADLGEKSPYRVHFLAGDLEIVAPSRRHESGKTRIGDLLLIYFLETNTEYFPMGSTTLRRPERQAGGEPDESYCIGLDKEFPDLAIEVIVTSGSINRLELYRRLGVREVWFWQSVGEASRNENRLALYHRREDAQFAATAGYEAIARSELLPGLDIELLTRCLQNPNPLAAARAFRQGLQ